MARPDTGTIVARLQGGNQRFAAGGVRHTHCDPNRLGLASREDQSEHALATVLACSDSRVPVECVFDAGVMDLFVVRVAGNVCGPDQAASVEYGLCHVRTPVLLVLGHARCGAVSAAVDRARGKDGPEPDNVARLLDRIAPAVARARAAAPGASRDELVARAVEENVWQCLGDLFRLSPPVRERVASGAVRALGAVYDLATGVVCWLGDARSLTPGSSRRP